MNMLEKLREAQCLIYEDREISVNQSRRLIRIRRLYGVWKTLSDDKKEDISVLALLADVAPKVIKTDYLPTMKVMFEMENTEANDEESTE